MKPSPTCEKTLLGQIIGGNFRIDGYLDSGAMASVYHATQLSLERRVALKVVHLSQIDHDTSERFLREAHVISRLEHPHIVRLYEFGKDTANDVLYLAMEFIEGVNLRHVTSRGRISRELVLEFGKQIARGLIEAHAKGIVHRDLKPANILIKPMSDGSLNLKVVDFGIARSLDVDGQLTAENIVCGTPRYLAPEQAISSREVTPAMDIYSFGVLLYELLVGIPPFEAPGGLEVILKHINDPPKPPSIFLPPGAIDDELEELVLSMLSKSPSRRPASSIEVLDALERIARRVREPIPRFKSSEPLTSALERLILDVPGIARAALERDLKGIAAPASEGERAATISDKKYFSDDYLAPDQRTHIEEAIQRHAAPSSDTSLISRYDTHPDAELLEITEEEAPAARSKRNNPLAAPHASEDPTYHSIPSPVTPSQSTESWPNSSPSPSHRDLDTARAERPSILSAASDHEHSPHDRKRFDLSMVDVLVALVMLVSVSTLLILWSLHGKDSEEATPDPTPRVAATVDATKATSTPPAKAVAEVDEDAREPEPEPEEVMEFEEPTPPEPAPAASPPEPEKEAAPAPRTARPENKVARVKKSPKKAVKKKPTKSAEIDLLAPKKKDDDVQESLRNSFKALKNN